jgi:D-glycero-D-manno-heptose 1,7-bisphosphate phosphatase
MKRVRIYVVLVAVGLAVVAALFHPLSLVLGFVPFDTRGLVAALVELRTAIANLLGWGLLSLLVVMVAYVAWGRRRSSHPVAGEIRGRRRVLAAPAYRAQIFLLIVVLAVLGAALHPIAFLLSSLPWNTTRLVSTLTSARTDIANLLGWVFAGLLIVMTVFVVRDRFLRRAGSTTPARSEHLRHVQEISETGRIAVAITAYNDAQATADAVRQFKSQPGVIEVIVIDNNSRDNTAELAAAAGARVIHEHRQGYGYACIRGLREAAQVPGVDIVVLTEGDGTFVGRDLPKFRAYIGEAEMVVGSRVTRELVEKGSQMDYFFTWGNIAVAFLLRLRFWDGQFLGAAGLTDVGCTFRAIRREALERMLPDLAVGGNHFLTHMMLVALSRGVSIVEIPVTFRRRVGKSKGASQSVRKGLNVGLMMIWQILTFRPSAAMPGKPAVFVDRDGVIIRNRADYVRAWSETELLPGAVEALATLSQNGHRVVVVTNQSAIGRGIVSRKEVRSIHRHIAEAVERAGGRIDSFLVCPHTPEAGCSCRKPRPGLLLKAQRQMKIDLASAYMVGDQPSDVEAARRAGCRPVMLMSPSLHAVPTAPGDCDMTPDLASAAALIVTRTQGHTSLTSIRESGDIEPNLQEAVPDVAGVRI